MTVINGRYYLTCNNYKYDNAANYHIYRIKKIRQMDSLRKPMKKVHGLESRLDLPKHMAEHIYMFSSESAPVRMRAKSILCAKVIDWFGKDVEFYDEVNVAVCTVH